MEVFRDMKNVLLPSLILWALILLGAPAAFGQSSVLPYYFNSSGVKTPVGTSNPFPVIGTGGIGPYAYTPLQPMQTNLGVASSTALTVPSGATYAVVCARAQIVNYSTDGTTTPTSSNGMQLQSGQCVALSGALVLSNFRAIQTTATATLDVSYFR